MCNVVITHFLKTFSRFDGNNDLKSSKALKCVLILLKSPPFPQKFSLFPPMKRFLSSRQDSIYASTEFTSFRSHFWVLISAGKGPHFTQRWVPIGSPFWNVLAQPSPYLVDPLPNAPTVLTLTFTKGAECETPRSRMQNRSRMRNTMFQNFWWKCWFWGQFVGPWKGNWGHFLVTYSCPGYPLGVWCFGEVQKWILPGIPESQSCSASAPP